MKIVHVSTYPSLDKSRAMDGVRSYTEQLVTNMELSTLDKMYVLADQLEAPESYTDRTVEIIRCYKRNSPLYAFQIYKQIKKLQPDIVHFQQELSLYGNVLTAYLLQWLFFKLRNRTVIVTVHAAVSLKAIDRDFIKANNSSLPVWLVKIAFRIIYKPLCRWAKAIIVHENEFKHRLVSEYGVRDSKITVIPHGVPSLTRLAKTAARRNLQIGKHQQVVLFMGYLTGYKGLDLLIEGFRHYADTNPNSLLLIGAGPHPKFEHNQNYQREYQRLENKARALIPAVNYRWMGFINQNELEQYFSAADVSIYPYQVVMSTSGPKAISIGHGVPFIASDLFEPLVEDKKLLFAREPEALAACVVNFFKHQAKYEQEIQKLRTTLLWDRISALTLSLYRQNL